MNISSHLKSLPYITMNDPLAQILGAIDDGLIQYSYLDCVKVSGHSCPTVASSFLMTKFALQKLNNGEVPIRGNFKVMLRDSKDQGITGIIGSISSFITGAADEGGFKGLGGKGARNNKLSFDNKDIKGLIRFERIDTGEQIDIDINLSNLPSPALLNELTSKIIAGSASEEEQVEFADLWQGKVRALLDSDDKHIVSTTCK